MVDLHPSRRLLLQLPLLRLRHLRQFPQLHRVPGSVKTLPSGLPKVGNGASRPLPRSRRDAGAKVYRRSTMSKLLPCLESRSPPPLRPHRFQPLPQHHLLQPHPAVPLAQTLPSGLRKEKSGASRPSRQNKRGVVAKVCQRSTMPKSSRSSESPPHLLQLQLLRPQRLPQLLPLPGLQPQPQLLQWLRPYPVAASPQATLVHPRSERPERRKLEASHRSARKTVKSISSAGDWCGVRLPLSWWRGSWHSSVSFCRALYSSLRPASRSGIPRSTAWESIQSSSKSTASGWTVRRIASS